MIAYETTFNQSPKVNEQADLMLKPYEARTNKLIGFLNSFSLSIFV